MNSIKRSPGACPRRRPRHARRLALVCALGLALAACAGPISAVRVDPKVVQADLGRSAITTGEPSWPTRNVLFERGLFDAFTAEPEAALADLHRAMVAAQGDPDLLFALAELSFLHGQAAKKPAYALAAAVYAYAFLFPEGAGVAPGRFDPRLRIAADLYNWALTVSFASKDRAEVVPQGGTFELPFGRIAVAFDPAALRAGDRELVRFTPMAELAGRGASHAISLARPRRPPCRHHPAPRLRAARAGPGGAAAPGAGDPPPPNCRGPAHPRAGRPARGPTRDPPGVGRGIGLDCGGAGAARERAHGGPGADGHRRAGLRDRDVRVPRPTHRADAGAAPPRLRHALQARAHPRGLRPRHGLQHRPLGGDVQPAAGRPRRSGAASRSGSSSTTPATPSRCPPSACARR